MSQYCVNEIISLQGAPFLLPRRSSLVVLQRKSNIRTLLFPLSVTVFSSVLHSYSPVVKYIQMQRRDLLWVCCHTGNCDIECKSTTAMKIFKKYMGQLAFTVLSFCNYMEPATLYLSSCVCVCVYNYVYYLFIYTAIYCLKSKDTTSTFLYLFKTPTALLKIKCINSLVAEGFLFFIFFSPEREPVNIWCSQKQM